MRKYCVLFFLLLLHATVLCSQTTRYVPLTSGSSVALPASYRTMPGEFRGIWVATVQNIDFGKNQTAAAYRKEFSGLLKNIKNAGFTALIFQIRPMNDAFYHSDLNPLSRWMTGAEGKKFTDEPGFDPLAYMIRETHLAGLEFHAWLNPYRVASRVQTSKQAYLKTLASNNFAAKNHSRMMSFFSTARTYGLIVAAISLVLYRTFAPFIVRAFISDAETVMLGTEFIKVRCLAPAFMFLSFHMVHFMQAVDRGKISFYLAVIRQLCLNIPIVLLLNYLFGMTGIVWTQMIADIINVIVSYIIYSKIVNDL